MPNTQMQLNSILTISQLNELKFEDLYLEDDEGNKNNIFDLDSDNSSVMEISYTLDTENPKYISRKIKASTLAKGINNVLIKNANLLSNDNDQLININELLNTVNNIINGDQTFTGKKIIENLYKSTQTDSIDLTLNNDGQKYVTKSEVENSLEERMVSFSNSQYISNQISNFINYQNRTNGNVNTYSFIDGEDITLSADNAGHLIIIGYVNADNSSIDSQYLYITLEIKKAKSIENEPDDFAIVAVQPYVIPMNGNSLQYFSFNIPVSKGTEFRVRTNFKLNNTYGGIPATPQNLTFNINDQPVLNGFRWYII